MKKLPIKEVKSSTKLFFAVGAFFFLLASQVKIFGDDVVYNTGGTAARGILADYFEQTAGFWTTWSSRIFVNYFVFFFNDDRELLWALCMGGAMLLLLWSLYYICTNYRSQNLALLIAVLALAFPYTEFCTAGWISTTVTYFFPTALGIYCLTAIKKAYERVTCRAWEYASYSLSLVFAANNEQMAVVLFAAYFAAAGYFLYRKRNHAIIWFFFLLSSASLALHFLAPGNAARSAHEMQYRFQTFDMMSFMDKAELGLSTTIRWLFFGGNLFVVFICVVLMIMMFERYQSPFYRTLALIPVVVTAGYNLFFNSLQGAYPWINTLSAEISSFGMIDASNFWQRETFAQFICFGALVCVVILELFLLLDTPEELIVTFTLLLSSVATRVAIGFSPTIFVSGNRTGIVMGFGLMAMTTYLVGRHAEKQKNSGKISLLVSNKMSVPYWLLFIFGMCGMLYNVV